MEVKDTGIEAMITFNSTKATYFFSFAEPESEASKINLLISGLPRKLYVDSFIDHIKR